MKRKSILSISGPSHSSMRSMRCMIAGDIKKDSWGTGLLSQPRAEYPRLGVLDSMILS